MGKFEKNKPDILDLDLLSFVSHELKSPLTILKLNTELLKRKTNPAHHSLINTMNGEIDWMIRFINDVLDLRAADNKVSLSMRWCKWNTIVQDVEKTLKTFLKSLDMELKIHWLHEDMEVYMDSLYIRQVLLNLIMNAVEHSREKNRIDIIWSKEQSGDLNIEVQDQGSGIEAQDLEKIFEPFYKGREKHSCTVRGSGLGLAFVKKIVQFHGGSVHARNRPEGGASFFIHLPQSRIISVVA